VSFDVSADSYLRFMGRYSEQLAALFADAAGVGAGHRVLDVGCGPGALAAELAVRAGAAGICAVEPSRSFAAAARDRLPGVFVAVAAAEALPFADGTFDAALAQLVVHFMADPVAGLREMARVCVAGGTVAACVWDTGSGRGPLGPFWAAARALDPAAPQGAERPGFRSGHLAGLFTQAGLGDVRTGELAVRSRFASFEQWWETFTLGVGPAGTYLATLRAEQAGRLRERCRAALPPGPFEIEAVAWTAAGRPLVSARRGRSPGVT
jgi:SAM-dependent methyltransferase